MVWLDNLVILGVMKLVVIFLGTTGCDAGA